MINQADYSHLPDINLDLLNLDNLDESLEMIRKCDPDFQFNSSQNTT